MYVPDHQGSIGVFDSGIGGLSVANAISGLLPRQSMLYVADNAHAPYGQRSDAEIVNYSRNITDFMLSARVRLIVVACNTATSVAIDTLRAEYPEVPFVGLEPAVKPAANGQNVGVMATELTLASPRYQALKKRFLADRPIWENPCKELVPLIEKYGAGHPELTGYLDALFANTNGLDTLVLGCTHYPLVVEDIRTALGPGVNVIDPSAAAARQVQRLLEKQGEVDVSAASVPAYDFWCTGSSSSLQRTLPGLRDLNARRRWVIPHLELGSEH